jgi:hypothetical protein
VRKAPENKGCGCRAAHPAPLSCNPLSIRRGTLDAKERRRKKSSQAHSGFLQYLSGRLRVALPVPGFDQSRQKDCIQGANTVDAVVDLNGVVYTMTAH